MKLEREPSNPYDCNAIAFMCQAEKDWERIGYVVSEALIDMNEMISNNKILKVYFSWIKYIVYYKQPGWYAGITVTRNGSWSRIVMQRAIKLNMPCSAQSYNIVVLIIKQFHYIFEFHF